MTPTPSTEQRQFINPIPATAGLGNPIKLAPEEHVPAPSTLTGNTVNSTVNLKELPEEEEDAKVSVAPIPATAGAGNPIHLAPGEKVPHPSTLTSNTINSTVRTDADSYTKSGSQAPQLPPVDITPQSERPANGGMFGLPAVSGSLVPESSLPMGVDALIEKDTGVHIQSAAPESSTAFLAGQVPKEPRGVPEVVTESQKEAGFAPEAAANSEAVLDKKEVEQELKEKVPEKTPAENDHAPTLESEKPLGDSIGAVAGGVAAAATVGAGLFTGAIYAAKEKTAEAVGLHKDATVGETASAVGGKAVDTVGLDSNKTAADNVYLAKDKTLDAVGLDKNATATDNAYLAKDKALDAAGLDKNATATDNAYLAKDKTLDAAGLDKHATATDNAYLAKDKTVHATGLDKAADSAYTAKDKAVAAVGLDNSASATENAYLAKDKAAHATGFNGSAGSAAAGDVPVVVAESQKEAHASPEAAANAEAVTEKSQFEQELLSQVPKSHDHGESAPSVAVPAVVSDSLRDGNASPEAAANFNAVHDKQGLEKELLGSVPRTNATGESAPAIAVPAIVSESQREAHSSPEAAANPLAVHDKKEFESELLKSVSPTNESGEHAPVIAAASSHATSGSKTELPVRSVPDIVAESQKEAHVPAEAAANAEAVAEKKELESELLSQVKKTNESGQPAPTISAATASTAPGLSGTGSSAPALSDSSYPLSTDYQPASEEEIKRALSGNSVEPTTTTGGLNAPASAPAQTETTKAVAESAVPVASTSKTDNTSAPTTDGLNAPASSVAQTEATKAAAESTKPTKEELFKPTTLEQRQPTVTTGTETGTTGTKSEGLATLETPQKDRKNSDVSPKGTPGSQSLASNSAVGDKKNKRRSFFGKLKDKFSNKN